MKTNWPFRMSDLLTTSQVASLVGKSVDTIRRWHRTRKLIPAVVDKRGSKSTRYYTKTQVKVFIRSMK